MTIITMWLCLFRDHDLCLYFLCSYSFAVFVTFLGVSKDPDTELEGTLYTHMHIHTYAAFNQNLATRNLPAGLCRGTDVFICALDRNCTIIHYSSDSLGFL